MHYDPGTPDGRKDMQSEADIKKVLQAAEEGPAADDDDMDSFRNLLRWILGEDYEKTTVDEFIRIEITDPYL
jgi:hypothetical protein